MALQLQKVETGQRINLSKENAGLKRLRIGLSWDVKDGITADLDASLLILGHNEKMLTDESIVFYNQPELYAGAIKHSGDERRGEKAGDDETILIDLTKLPSDVRMMLAVITIYGSGQGTPITFGRVKNATVRLYDADKDQALYEYDLTEDASRGTAVEMARLYFKDNAWRYTSLGEVVGYSQNGLTDIINRYQP